MNGKTSSVAEMAARLADDPAMAKNVEAQGFRTRLVSALVDTRIRKRITQKTVAERMKVSSSAVSRIEDLSDKDLRLGDVIAYSRAIGMNVSLLVEDSDLHTAARIKNCVFMLADNLHRLSELAAHASDDKSIVDGIRRFRSEVLLNFLIKYKESGETLPPFIFGDREGEADRDGRAARSSVRGASRMGASGELTFA